MEHRRGPYDETLKVTTWLDFISVKAINVGHRPVEIISAGLGKTYGGKMYCPTRFEKKGVGN